MHYIVGLGNPGAEYEATRHNAGRMVLAHLFETHGFAEPVPSAKYASLIAEGEVAGASALVMFPETFMNKSGSAVAKAVTSVAKAKKLIVVYDEIDLPLGTLRVAYGRGAGGHRGLDSIIRALKTKDFVRVRVGVSPVTPAGKLKKPKGEGAVVDFLLGVFKPSERKLLDTVAARVTEVIETVLAEGHTVAMNRYNGL